MAVRIEKRVAVNAVIDYLKSGKARPLKVRQLAKELSIRDQTYGQFRRLVRELLRCGKLVKLKGGRIGLPEMSEKRGLIAGKIFGHRNGYAFLTPEEGGEDIYIGPENLRTALHGDRVLIALTENKSGRRIEGRVVKILERARTALVGTFNAGRHFYFVVPDNERFAREIRISASEINRAKPGQKVVVRLKEWKDEYQLPEGKIVEVLGYPGEKGLDILTVIREYDLPSAFPEEVETEAARIDQEIPSSEIKRRLDLRQKVCFTIDPQDARDHDDAVSLEKLPRSSRGHWRLGVHIADVSYYVRENTALNREALLRGTSVYFPDRVIPMLPERLSADLCSLRAHRVRLTFSCLMDLDKSGQLVNTQVGESVIISRARLNYEEVQTFFDTGKTSPAIAGLEQDLEAMREVSLWLLENRKKSGSLDFDLPEPQVLLDKQGRAIEVYQRERWESHRLIEEFMLLANQTVARLFTSKNFPTLFRVHDRPDLDKMESFSLLMADFGYKLHLKDELTPKRLARFLDQVKGRSEEELVNELLLRSLKKAVYQPQNIGHFGLGFGHYLHFTSPIRRYPDLLVHRLLKELLAGGPTLKRYRWLQENLSKIGQIASERERIADEAERIAIRVKQLEFMSHKLGEVYAGVVSGITKFGVFVRLKDLGVEGLIRFSALGDDYYIVDQERHCLVGRATKKVIRLGDLLQVQVVRVDELQKRIDLVPVIRPEFLKKRGRRKKESGD